MTKKKLINSQNVDKTLKLYIKKKTIIVSIKIFKFKSSEHRSNTKLIHEQWSLYAKSKCMS